MSIEDDLAALKNEGDLAELKSDLLRRLDIDLTPEQGDEAFERHQLLAIRFHRAARLNSPGLGEWKSWRRYFEEHFARGSEHAARLWNYWRNPLIKDEFPGSQVAISHGQPHGHWQIVDPGARLYVNLESMRDDFTSSIESMIALLRREPARQAATLAAWETRQWSVQMLTFVAQAPTVSASVTSGAATAASHD